MISLVSFSLGRDGSWGIELDPDLNVQLNSLGHVFFYIKTNKNTQPKPHNKRTTTTKQRNYNNQTKKPLIFEAGSGEVHVSGADTCLNL